MNYRVDQAISPDSYSGQTDSALLKSRSRRPCDSCRRRKSRCEMIDGATSCVLCRFHRQECTFLAHPQPRKRKAASLSEEEGSHGNPSRDAARRPPQLSSDKHWLPRRSSGDLPHRSSQNLIRQDPPIDDYANLKGPSLLKKTLGLQNHRHSRFIGSASVFEQSLLLAASADENYEIPLAASSIRKVNDNTSFLLRPDAGTQNRD